MKNKIKQIEDNIKNNLALKIYEAKYEILYHMEIQNNWFSTQAGKDSIGSLEAEKMIKNNNLKVEGIKTELEFLKTQINNYGNVKKSNLESTKEKGKEVEIKN